MSTLAGLVVFDFDLDDFQLSCVMIKVRGAPRDKDAITLHMV